MPFQLAITPTWQPSGSAIADALAQSVVKGRSSKQIAALIQRAHISAIKGESFVIMRSIKAAIKTNRFNWPAKQRYGKTGDVMQSVRKKYPAVDRGAPKKRRATTTPGQFYGQLARVFFYRFDKTDDSATIGIIPGFKRTSANAEQIARRLASGGTTAVTSRSRRYFGALGMPISAPQFILPPRPLVESLWQQDDRTIKKHLEDRFIERLMGYK